MGRQRRIDAPGCWHHVMNRGAGRRIVFRDDQDRAFFLDLLAQVEERFGVEVHAFCLMGNHYHCVLRSTEGRLSDAMAWLGSQFTLVVNARRGVDGAIFRGRFHSVLVERESHLDWLFRYVNANPLDLGWSGPLASYPWSGLAATLGSRKDQPWVRTDFYIERFGADRLRLERFVEAARDRCVENDDVCAGLNLAAVKEAVQLARGPGPGVNTDAEARAATVVLGVRVGVDPVEACAPLTGDSANAYLRRARDAALTSDTVEQLVARAGSVLHVVTHHDRRRSCV